MNKIRQGVKTLIEHARRFWEADREWPHDEKIIEGRKSLIGFVQYYSPKIANSSSLASSISMAHRFRV